jgi:hypothetical protein
LHIIANIEFLKDSIMAYKKKSKRRLTKKRFQEGGAVNAAKKTTLTEFGSDKAQSGAGTAASLAAAAAPEGSIAGAAAQGAAMGAAFGPIGMAAGAAIGGIAAAAKKKKAANEERKAKQKALKANRANLKAQQDAQTAAEKTAKRAEQEAALQKRLDAKAPPMGGEVPASVVKNYGGKLYVPLSYAYGGMMGKRHKG